MTTDTHSHVVPLPQEALPRDGRAPLDPDAAAVAWSEYEAVVGQVSTRDAVILAALAYVRRQDARRARWVYPLANGQRIPGIHPGMVAALLSTLHYYGQLEGPAAEDAGARALAAVNAWVERHGAEDRAHERRHAEHARQIAADLEQARRRAEIHRTVNGGGR